MGVERSEVDRQWCIVQEWLSTSDARAAAASSARRYGIVGVEADDVLSETSLRVWRSLQRRATPVDEGEDGRGLIRYARRTMDHATVDILRSHQRRREVLVDDLDLGAGVGPGVGDGARPGTVPPDDLLDALLGTMAGPDGDGAASDAATWLDDARRDLHSDLGRDAVGGAAALMTLGIVSDDLALSTDVAQPERGATAAQAAGWAGLWFAGRRDLFPTDADAAARQRRSRAVRAIGARIERAIEAVGGRG